MEKEGYDWHPIIGKALIAIGIGYTFGAILTIIVHSYEIARADLVIGILIIFVGGLYRKTIS